MSYTGWRKRARPNLHQNANKSVYELSPLKDGFLWLWPFDEWRKFSEWPPYASRQDVARLNSDCPTGWKIIGFVRIISNPFCIRLLQYWKSLNSAAQTLEFKCPPEIKILGDTRQRNKQATVLVYLICSIVPETSRPRIHEIQGEDVVEYQCWIYHKWIVEWASISCNSSGRTSWKEVGLQKSVWCRACLEAQGWHFENFL